MQIGAAAEGADSPNLLYYMRPYGEFHSSANPVIVVNE